MKREKRGLIINLKNMAGGIFMKKRVLTALAAAGLCVGLFGCTPESPPIKDPDPTGTTTVPDTDLQTILDTPLEAVSHYDWAEELPVMDGSTSTIPLEAGLRAALFGTSQSEAERQVIHSTTYGSFYNLVDGKCDLIFTVPLSGEQIDYARERGVEFTMTPVAAEGFVFVLNAANPVTELSQQQLRDIYSGKITNWKEVGGDDAPIIAYQRNETSGSQNYMHEFMGDTPLQDPLTSAMDVPSGMGALMDAVALYDNAKYAIGYSVYAYAADMYVAAGQIKFVAVDGVAPSKATMAEGTYPLLSYNYAVYNKDTPADSNLQKFVDWIVTDEGQRAVKAAGYVPLRPVGDLTELTVARYAAVGTGPKKPEGHTLAPYRYEASLSEARHLKNEALRDEVKAFIREATKEMGEARHTEFKAINGYLSVLVYGSGDGRAALYDLVSGKRIAFSDLFYEGENFVDALNADLYRTLSGNREAYIQVDVPDDQSPVDDRLLKRDFVGIPAGHDQFTLTGVYFPRGGLYFGEGTLCEFFGLRDKMTLYDERDMADCFDDTVTVNRVLNTEAGQTVQKVMIFKEFGVSLMDERVYDPAVCKKVNAAVTAYCEKYYSEKAVAAHFKTRNSAPVTPEWFNTFFWEVGDRYIWYDVSAMFRGGLLRDDYERIYFSNAWFFDLKTGEEVPYTVFLKDGWAEHSQWTDKSAGPEEPVDYWEAPVVPTPALDSLRLTSFNFGNGLSMDFEDPENGNRILGVTVPDEYVNWEL